MMRRILLTAYMCFLVCFSCKKQEEPEIPVRVLDNTEWQLVGLVDTNTGNVKAFIPQDGNNFLLGFTYIEETTFYIKGFTSANELYGQYSENNKTNSITDDFAQSVPPVSG